ncbi:glycosyltransferase family 4 protein [Bacillus haikouensis]|nr:glycosyltransferase family 4 protein [Bacillus haikouensis]
MKKVYVATKARGFLLNLFNSNHENFKFTYEPNKIYETNTKRKILLSKLVKSRIADYCGIIQRINVKNKACDVVFSYNRFLKTKSDYIIYLENPLALVHYSTSRGKTLLSKRKLKKYFNDPKLKSIICLSKACYDTLNDFYVIPNSIKVEQIYPLVKPNYLTNRNNIKAKCNQEEIKCLYISSKFHLKGGKDILQTFNKLKESGINNVKLNIITQVDSIEIEMINEIKKNQNIDLFDFKFNKEELNEIYNDSCILLNPTRQDSFSLVVLEAMKSGNAILTTDLYAIPEMVIDRHNGYLTEPKYRFFNYDNMPNTFVWNNRNTTIHSNYIDLNIVNFLFEKIVHLNENREELEKMAVNSFNKANFHEFNENFIKKKWNGILG